jgi:hypothetical protein
MDSNSDTGAKSSAGSNNSTSSEIVEQVLEIIKEKQQR